MSIDGVKVVSIDIKTIYFDSSNHLKITIYIYLKAGQDDFDSFTGELKSNKKSRSASVNAATKQQQPPLILDHDKTTETLLWLSSDRNIVFKVTDIEERTVSRKPPPAYITSTLQQDGSIKLGLSPSRTMSIAQELYEEGFITYMRTDSPVLSSLGMTAAQGIALNLFGPNYLQSVNKNEDTPTNSSSSSSSSSSKKSKTKVSKKSPKNAQEAHEAIRPADTGGGKFKMPQETQLTGIKLELYSLIFKRTIASVMASSISDTITYTISAEGSGSGRNNNPKTCDFRSSDTSIKFNGYLAIYYDDVSSVGLIPKLTKSQQIWPFDINLISKSNKHHPQPDLKHDIESESEDGLNNEINNDNNESNESNSNNQTHEFENYGKYGLVGTSHVTRPPTRFTEAGFIKELESVGVGRPSTYSKIFDTLKKREYVTIDGRTIIPTLKGLLVDQLLTKHFNDIVQPEFTATMEKGLDLIAHGEANKLQFLTDYYLGSKDKTEEKTEFTGLIPRVTEKLLKNEIDQKNSRSLDLPHLDQIAKLQLIRGGLYVTANKVDNPILKNFESNFTYHINGSNDGLKWMLPDFMQSDIRTITKESVMNVMQNEMTSDGAYLGLHPTLQSPVYIRSGRYGKYLQIGSVPYGEQKEGATNSSSSSSKAKKKDKDIIIKSVPNSLPHNLPWTLEEALPFGTYIFFSLFLLSF